MKETMLQVDGMSCPSCVRHIDSALRELGGGVAKVDVRLREGTVVVQHDPTSAPVDALVEAVRGAGYDVRPRAA
ncbi:heavy-metal-associated domain-containing protein [Sorangium atrum]|uniref:Heavy-metal-associated domain-containing protein n=1 Tax=Sorangium atrum TaxID=2995308 RepID=A0ABT5CHC0_9BACT|nr:heavy-metal-associated domain-containing protein [Sorangium aterium]MDC0684471.1 heavy-metal-associated domain-containing protein [Sorangium aterium]